ANRDIDEPPRKVTPEGFAAGFTAAIHDPPRKVNVEVVPDKKSDANEPLSGDDEDTLLAAMKAKGIKASQSDDWIAEHCFEDLGISKMSEAKKGQLAAILGKLNA